MGRRLDALPGKLGVGHAYNVSNAQHIGDPKATVHSYGKLRNGNMGNVGAGSQPADISIDTAESDLADWLSRTADTTENISRIDAPDSTVADLAGAVSEDNPYALLPSGEGLAVDSGNEPLNSNSAAFAVADRAEQIASGDPNAGVDREPFKLRLPGANRSAQVGFRGTFQVKGRIDSRRNELPETKK